MKKILSFSLAIIMILTTFSAILTVTSADEADTLDYIDATLNEVTLDGELHSETGKWNTMKVPTSSPTGTNIDKATIVIPGTPSVAEFVMDKKASGCYLGAAWSLTTKNVYFGFAAYEPIQNVTIEIGGKTAELDATISESVTGIAGASAKKDLTELFLEIALPIEGLLLYENERYVYTDLKITVNGKAEDAFDGIVQFTDYSANFVFDGVNKTVNEDLGSVTPDNARPTISEGNVVNLLDNTNPHTVALQRLYYILKPDATITLGKNFAYEFDMTVNDMPATLPFNGGPTKLLNESEDAHMWCLIRTAYNEMFHFNIINHPNYGICMLVQSDAMIGTGFDLSFEPKDAKLIKLGCSEGEKFTLKIEWFEDNSVTVSVNNKVLEKLEDSLAHSPNLGGTIGVVMFNTGRITPLAPNETIDVDISNISIGLLNAEYDKDALLAMAANKQAPTDEEPTGDAPEDDGDDNADTTDNSSEEEKKGGCGSSVAGIGAVASLGLALTAVLTTKKKED